MFNKFIILGLNVMNTSS